MIVVDSSAIIAIMFDAAEAPSCMTALQKDGSRLISAVNYVEAGTVMAGKPGAVQLGHCPMKRVQLACGLERKLIQSRDRTNVAGKCLITLTSCSNRPLSSR